MDKSRLLPQLDLLEKYSAGKSSFKSKEEEILNFRTLTGKILNQLEGPEKLYRDVIMKHTGQIDALVSTLQTINDSQTSYNIIKIFCELVGKSNSGKRAQILVHHGVTKAILQCIYIESKEQVPCEDYLFLLHQVLYKVGLKDRRIGVRARISQCLPVIVNLLRSQINLVPHIRSSNGNIPISNSLSKNILNLLHVLKLYSINLINTSRLGRMGIINSLLKCITYSAKNNANIFKISVETLNLSVRTKSNSSRAINLGAVNMLLELFMDFHKIDTKCKQIGIRKSIICVIKNLVNIRSGKKAFMESDGLHTLYGFCESNKHQPNLESLVTLGSLILRKCFPKNRLPLSHYGSVIKCPIPNITYPKSRILLDYNNNDSSPSAPRSTSPIDIDGVIQDPNSQGDIGKNCYNRIENSEDDDYFQEMKITEENFLSRCISQEKSNNRIRADNLFRSLDKKMSTFSYKEPMLQQLQQQKHHSNQNYMNKTLTFTNDGDSDINLAQQKLWTPSILRSNDSNPYASYMDEKRERNDQVLAEQMFVNLLPYQSLDDRPFDKLKLSYDKFLLEREVWKKTNNKELRRKSFIDESDKSDKSENSLEDGINPFMKRHKNNQTKKVNVPLQSKMMSLDEKLSRISIRQNSMTLPKSTELANDKLALTCSGINFHKRESNTARPSSGGKGKGKIGSSNEKKNDWNKSNLFNNEKKKDVTEDYLSKILSMNLSHDFPTYDFDDSENNSNDEFTDNYIKISSLVTRSLGRFSLIAYPDLMEESVKITESEPLSESFLQNLSLMNDGDFGSKSNSNNNNGKKILKNLTSLSKKSSMKFNKVSGSSKATNSIPRPSSATCNIESLAQNKILDDVRRIIDGEDILEKIVFDLDNIVQSSMMTYNLEHSSHSNFDELQVDKLTPLQSPTLQFDSQFECGNLRKAIQIRQYEYDLILNPDVNSNHQIQWFYFRISAMEAGIPYRFNIINCEKPNSQFNFGMKPLFYSVKEAMLGKSYWRRYGSEIFYYKNHFARSASTNGGVTGKSYFTFTFVIDFPYESDVCYIAYHYPYTYTRLLTDLHYWTQKVRPNNINSCKEKRENSKEKLLTHKIEFYSLPEDNIQFYIQELCTTILGNPVPVLTISNWSKKNSDPSVVQKPYIFLTGRVHPGESNASWIMKGCIDYLLSNNPVADQLRNRYIFKIIPMLNPDGVINGCHRFSMAGHDLNRRWLDPCEILNPTIYHTKGLLMLLSKYGLSPLVYCDFHGHSRRKNVFMFGCSPFQSWINEDSNNTTLIDQRNEDKSYLVLPNILNNISQAFSFESCSFTVEKSKFSTARVVVWRQFGVKRSYTMESTYCSCDQGSYKNLHVNVNMLLEIGRKFAEALNHVEDSTLNSPAKNYSLPKMNTDSNLFTDKICVDKFPYCNYENKYDMNGRQTTELNSIKDMENNDDEYDDISSNSDSDEEEMEEEESESDKELPFNYEEAEDSD